MSDYEILGVKENATKSEIEKAYRSAVKHLHSDTDNASSTEVLLQIVQSAYERLLSGTPNITSLKEYSAVLESFTKRAKYKDQRENLLTAILIKVVISCIAVFLVRDQALIGGPAIVLIVIVFYALFSIYHFSLQLTHNYLVAFLVSGGILALISQETTKLEHLSFLHIEGNISLTFVLNIVIISIPLIWDITRFVILSRKINQFYIV